MDVGDVFRTGFYFNVTLIDTDDEGFSSMFISPSMAFLFIWTVEWLLGFDSENGTLNLDTI